MNKIHWISDKPVWKINKKNLDVLHFIDDNKINDFIKDFSLYQIGDTISRECEECDGHGKNMEAIWHNELSKGGNPQKEFCENCQSTGKTEHKLKAIELKQVKDIPDKYHVDKWLIRMSGDTWLCVGNIKGSTNET